MLENLLNRKYKLIQISDQDLIGNRFNGHNLHKYLNALNFDCFQYVSNKKTEDKTTFKLDNNGSYAFIHSLIYNKIFAEADIIHLHLMCNTSFDINFLPLLCSLKPVVWTLHDPWSLGGHCVYPGKCPKYIEFCHDCEHLSKHFSREIDSTALEFAQKKFSVNNSSVIPVVASKWMKKKVELSPIWKGKEIHLVPFGIEQNIFKPEKTSAVRKTIKIPVNQFTIFSRIHHENKGLDILYECLDTLSKKMAFTLITVGKRGYLTNLPKNIKYIEYEWITDETHMAKLYQACDIFLMPSENEAFGMMAIEAMSCGKPVLALDVEESALPDVINSPYCGLAVLPGLYASTLCRLAGQPEELAFRGIACLDYARKAYNLDTYLNRLLKVYGKAISEFKLSPDARLTLEQIKKYAPEFPHI